MAESKYSSDFLAQQREAKSIRKSIDTARGLIEDALLRYKKKMLHAKSKKQTEDFSMFAELDGYSSKDDIQIVFGYGDISDDAMHRLWDLWDAREIVVANQGRYADRVTQILERAMENSGDFLRTTLKISTHWSAMITKTAPGSSAKTGTTIITAT